MVLSVWTAPEPRQASLDGSTLARKSLCRHLATSPVTFQRVGRLRVLLLTDISSPIGPSQGSCTIHARSVPPLLVSPLAIVGELQASSVRHDCEGCVVHLQYEAMQAVSSCLKSCSVIDELQNLNSSPAVGMNSGPTKVVGPELSPESFRRTAPGRRAVVETVRRCAAYHEQKGRKVSEKGSVALAGVLQVLRKHRPGAGVSLELLAEHAPAHFEAGSSTGEKFGVEVYASFETACKDFAAFGVLLKSLAEIFVRADSRPSKRKVLPC